MSYINDVCRTCALCMCRVSTLCAAALCNQYTFVVYTVHCVSCVDYIVCPCSVCRTPALCLLGMYTVKIVILVPLICFSTVNLSYISCTRILYILRLLYVKSSCTAFLSQM